jgi:23S rRNA (cytosine1962-C5)-methyltransferase
VGWFPEKTALVDALAALVSRAASVLHLFAYTGAATLALARAGARVTHVDAASSAVAWARRNATRNDLAERPIRWIVEDAARWVARETRRGAQYDAILLDPPSFGRGGGKRSWRMERDLEPLLTASTALLSDDPLFVALTAHTEGMSSADLAEALDRALANRSGHTRHGGIELAASSGARLPAGVFAWRAFGVDFPRRVKRGEPA